MAKVEWSAGIDSVSGALAKPSKSGQHSCTKMLLATITADQEAFEAQKNLSTGKKTFNAYLWKVCGEAYDLEHPKS